MIFTRSMQNGKKRIAEHIGDKILMEVKKRIPIIDAWIASKVQDIYYKVQDIK